jgi:hypothetical protein
MPGKSAADAQWEALAELQHLQAMLAGFVSQLASGKVGDRNQAGYAMARAVLSDRRLGELLAIESVMLNNLLDLLEGRAH